MLLRCAQWQKNSRNQLHDKTIWQLRSRGNGALQESLYSAHKTFAIFLLVFLLYLGGISSTILADENTENRDKAKGKLDFYNCSAWKWDAMNTVVAGMNIDWSAGDKKSQIHLKATKFSFRRDFWEISAELGEILIKNSGNSNVNGFLKSKTLKSQKNQFMIELKLNFSSLTFDCFPQFFSYPLKKTGHSQRVQISAKKISIRPSIFEVRVKWKAWETAAASKCCSTK